MNHDPGIVGSRCASSFGLVLNDFEFEADQTAAWVLRIEAAQHERVLVAGRRFDSLFEATFAGQESRASRPSRRVPHVLSVVEV